MITRSCLMGIGFQLFEVFFQGFKVGCLRLGWIDEHLLPGLLIFELNGTLKSEVAFHGVQNVENLAFMPISSESGQLFAKRFDGS